MPVESFLRADTRWWLPGATMRAIPAEQSHTASEAPDVGAAMTRNMYINDKTIFNAIVFPGPGTGNRPPSTIPHRQRIATLNLSAAAVFEGYSPRTPLYPGPALASFVDVLPPLLPEAARYDILLARPTAASTLDLNGGVAVMLSSGAFAGGIVTEFLNGGATLPPGYAVVGDGGTGYRFQARAVLGAALTTDIPLVWPVPVDEFATVSFRFLAATRTADMQFRLLVNDVVFFTQDLGAAGAPGMTGAFRFLWRLVVQGSSSAGFDNVLTDDNLMWWGSRELF